MFCCNNNLFWKRYSVLTNFWKIFWFNILQNSLSEIPFLIISFTGFKFDIFTRRQDFLAISSYIKLAFIILLIHLFFYLFRWFNSSFAMSLSNLNGFFSFQLFGYLWSNIKLAPLSYPLVCECSSNSHYYFIHAAPLGLFNS